MRATRITVVFLLAGSLLLASAQEPDTLSFDTADFTVKLVKGSQTIAALQPKGAGGFDFTPADKLEIRSVDGFNSIGDLTLRLRQEGSAGWQTFSTSAAKRPVEVLPAAGSVLAAANLAATLPADCPIQVIRRWVLDNGKLVLRFELKNTGAQRVEIWRSGNAVDLQQYAQGSSAHGDGAGEFVHRSGDQCGWRLSSGDALERPRARTRRRAGRQDAVRSVASAYRAQRPQQHFFARQPLRRLIRMDGPHAGLR